MRTGRVLTIVGVSALVLVLTAVTVTSIQRQKEADAQIAALTRRVEASEAAARAAAARAESSSEAALEAKDHARRAAELRRYAESEKVRAEAEKQQAEAVAADAQQQAKAAQAEAERVRQERQAELDRMQQALDRIVETRRTAVGMVMNLPEKALRFDFDSAELRPEGREVLSRIAGILLTAEDYGLSVHGHTDDTGNAEYNQKLSERRAQAVKDYLKQAGINPAIVTVKGFGKSSPLAKGRDDSSRAKNRRVEIALTDSRIRYRGEVVN